MKKGFTLVEILAVLALLSAIMIIIIPNITNSSLKAKEKMYETKKESIIKAYKMCESDGLDDCETIQTLLDNGYILPDNFNDENVESCKNNCIENPVNGKYIDRCVVFEDKQDIICK